MRRAARTARGWPEGCSIGNMSFALVVDLVRSEFIEMPGMELTMAQDTRLWNLGPDDCRHVLDALVDTGFLRWTPRRTVMRTGRSLPVGDSFVAHNSVLVSRSKNKSV
jgi:hypothetical protein